MNGRFIFLVLWLLMLTEQTNAADLGFRYREGKCQNPQGESGLNPSFFGPCSDLRGVVLGRLDFSGIDFSGSQFVQSDLQKSIFKGANLTATNFEGANLAGVNLESTQIEFANFKNAKLKNVSFSGAKVSKSDLSGVDFRESILSYFQAQACNFSGANFAGVSLDRAALFGNQLDGANFAGADLSFADLNHVNLKSAILDHGSFDSTNLQGAILDGASVSAAIFKSTNLTQASLKQINFRAASFGGPILNQADLSGSDLRRVDFSSAQVTDARFVGAKYNQRSVLPFSNEVAQKLGMIQIKTPTILVIQGRPTDEVDQFIKFLIDQEIDVTVSAQLSRQFDGTERLDAYDSILQFNGNAENMPDSGQVALSSFVRTGGILVNGEWNGYEFKNNELQKMGDLILMDHADFDTSAIEFLPNEAGLKSPLLQGITSIKLQLSFGHDTLKKFASEPATSLMTFKYNGMDFDGLAVRNFGKGRIMTLATACDDNDGCLTDPSMRKLFVNAVSNGW